MARQLRIEYPGAYYHIINRGHNRERIFSIDRDIEKFLEYLEKTVERFSIILHTYCIMGTHYHLLIETPEPNLSVAIQWLNVSYAAYFNTKHKRSGHLFQGRFKSILIEADRYLKQLSRYIHLNPVRARIVDTPLEYKWSSYPAFAGKVKAPFWLECDSLLSVFNENKTEAVKDYRQFVEDVNMEELENPHKHVIGGFILGDNAFADWVKGKFLSLRDDEKEIPQLRRLKPWVSIETVIQEVCKEFRCTSDDIRERGHKKNIARETAIFIARDLCGTKNIDLGTFFGNVSGASITMTYKKVLMDMSSNKSLKGIVSNIKQRIYNVNHNSNLKI